MKSSFNFDRTLQSHAHVQYLPFRTSGSTVAGSVFFSRTLSAFIKANKKQQRDTRASVRVVIQLTNILPAHEKCFAHMTDFFYRWNLHKAIRAKVASHHGDRNRIRTVQGALEHVTITVSQSDLAAAATRGPSSGEFTRPDCASCSAVGFPTTSSSPAPQESCGRWFGSADNHWDSVRFILFIFFEQLI